MLILSRLSGCGNAHPLWTIKRIWNVRRMFIVLIDTCCWFVVYDIRFCFHGFDKRTTKCEPNATFDSTHVFEPFNPNQIFCVWNWSCLCHFIGIFFSVVFTLVRLYQLYIVLSQSFGIHTVNLAIRRKEEFCQTNIAGVYVWVMYVFITWCWIFHLQGATRF